MHFQIVAAGTILDSCLVLARSSGAAEWHFNSKLYHYQLLTVSTHNNQVCNAGYCIRNYLPPLIKTHGRYMKRKDLKELKDVQARYPQNPIP